MESPFQPGSPSFLQPKPPAPRPGVEATLQERLALYQTAMESARQAGDGTKMRRYDRGLKVRKWGGGCRGPDHHPRRAAQLQLF